MSANSFSGENPPLPPDQTKNESAKPNPEEPRQPENLSESQEEDQTQNASDPLQGIDGQRRIMRERPFISSRLSVPNDPVQPRGVSTFTRFSAGYSRNRSRSAFGSGLGMDDELESTNDSQPAEERNSFNQDLPEQNEVSGSAPAPPEPGAGDYRRTGGYDGGARTQGRAPNGYGKRGSYRDSENFQRGNGMDGPRNYGGYDPRGPRPPRRPYTGGYDGGGRENPGYGRENPGGYGRENSGYGRENPGGFGRENPGYGRENSGYGRETPGGYGRENPGGYGRENPGFRENRGWRNDGNRPNDGGNYGRRGFNRPYRRGNTEGYSQFNPAFPELKEPRFHKEPLSLAEELAEEMSRGHRPEDEKMPEMLLQDATVGRLQQLSIQELIAEARRFEIGVPDEESVRKQDLIFSIIKEKIKLNGLLYGEGTLEILPDGFGFLRSTEYNYLSCPDDIYVSPSQIRRFGLRNGSCVSGQIRPPKENERYFALLRVEAINFRDPNEFRHRKMFEEMTPMHPTQPMKLECGLEELETRILDLISPVGFGQRGLIVGPKGSGKTTLLTKIARAALKNYPDLYVFLLSVDENDAEVEELRKFVKGLNCEVVSSTTDEPVLRHIQVADMVLEKAKRMVEFGQNVLILIDSMTNLARAWHMEGQMGRPMDGMYGNGMMQNPRGFFASARALEEGGSLTILATLTNETEDPLETAICDEFKGTGNLEIVLDQRLAEQKVWPAIDVNQSGTHREEMLRTPAEFQAITTLRSFLADLNPVTAMEMLTKRLGKTESNEKFLESLN